ncbi:PEP-CTERM sorting domain-containing protein [Phragmitibacter flavus]|uniref:PEP-CTERM sorting domain-containing protein n=1 Tax=Phragmitibacter flavus TaxID=2576071 RepID=A0A5R8KIW4_9BACT|nr:autotransporter-associated beta strand repeat-containing protein [Phragmitibacter flavus]TLD72181.1 PEP-CTERM sorting domain-containing protein [Phragmitibacter flavus]
MKPSALFIFVLSLAAWNGPSTAATHYWDGQTSSSWNNLTNWTTDTNNATADPAAIPGTNGATSLTDDQVVFNASIAIANQIATLDAALQVNQITFDSNSTTPLTIAAGTGGSLTLGSGGILINSGAAAHTISAPTTIGAVQSWTNNSASLFTVSGTIAAANALTIDGTGNTTISGIMSGAGNLIKDGAGTLLFTVASTKTGTIQVNSGVLQLNHTVAGTIASSISVASGATLRSTTASIADALALTIDGTYEIFASDTIGSISGGGLVTKTTAGSATMTLNGSQANTFTGIIENGAGTIAVTKTGTNTQTFTGANTFTGTLSINNGTAGSPSLLIAGANASLATNTINVGDGNGGNESLTVGAVGDVIATPLNRLSDTATVTLNSSTGGGFTYIGPASGSASNVETIGTLAISAGRNQITLVPGTGNEVQITASALTRANNGTMLIRGDNLGGAGPGSTRLLAPATLSGANGADGTTQKSILAWGVGGDSATSAGTDFLTYDNTSGYRLLTAAEYASTISGSNTPLRNVSTAGAESIIENQSINSLRLTGGTTTIDAGQHLLVNSGAVLFTGAATINGPGFLNFGTSQGIIQTTQNTATTSTIHARIGGTNGLVVGTQGTATNITELGGDNTFIGTLTVNGGTLRLASSSALNDNSLLTVTARAGSIVQLNGNNATVRNLASASGAGTFQNGSATAATLTTYQTASSAVSTIMSNGSTGTLGLVVGLGGTASFDLTLGASNSYTGSTEIRGARLILSGNGVGAIASQAVNVNGGILQLASTSSNNLTNRISNTATVALNAGTFDFSHSAGAASYSETVGSLNLASGANTVTVDKADLSGNRTSVLTFTNALARSAGATVNFTSQTNNVAIYDLGTTAQSRLVFTAAPTLDDGILGGWATIDSSANTREFAKYVSSGIISVTALTAGEYTNTLTSGTNTAQNVKITASPAALTGATQINSLNVQQASATTLDLGGHTLRVETGGIITSGDFNASFINGTLTAGTGDNAPGELIFHTLPTTTSAVSWVNATDLINYTGMTNGSPVAFTTAPGGLTAGVTYYAVNSTGTTFQVATSPGGPPIALSNDGTTAVVIESSILTVDAVIQDNGTGSVALTKTGNGVLDLQGVTNTYSGKTTLSGGTLRIDADANLGTAPAAPSTGHLTLSNNSTLNITQNFTLNANRGITIGAGNNIISIASGTTGNGKTLTYNGAITSLGSSEGNLHFKSNAVTTSGADVGEINANLTDLDIGGSLRVDAGNITVTGPTNTIGHSLQVGMDGVTNFTYSGSGGSLTVGQGASEVLDLGVSSSNAVTTAGTLDLTALDNFTANVNTIRLGIGSTDRTGQGTLKLATNNKITATTSIMIGSNGGGGQEGITSSMSFGSGQNDVITQLFTVGSLKSTSVVDMANGGTLSLNGAGQRTLDLRIGHQAGNTATTATGTVNLSNGTLTGSFDELIVGFKSGGGNGGGLGTLTLSSNTANLVEANTVTLGSLDGASGSSAKASGFGTFSMGGGSFTLFSDLAMGLHTNSGTFGTSRGIFNLTGGESIIGGNIPKPDSDRSAAIITVDGATAVLDLRNDDFGDATEGTINASQLIFRQGNIIDTASATLDGRGVTSATVFAALDDALIMRDVTVDFDVNLTQATAGLGGILYESAAAGAGGTINGDVDLGTVDRDINVQDNASIAADLTIAGAITNAGGVNKQGLGTLVLRSSANTYGGPTTVTNGVLQVGLAGIGTTGSAATAVTSTGTLAGTGTVTGPAVTHTISGALRPGDDNGNAMGILNFEGSLTFSTTATAFFQLGSPGSTYDRINGTSTGDTISLDGQLSAAEPDDSFFGGYLPSAGDTWTLLLDWSVIDLANFDIGSNFRTGVDGGSEGDFDLPTLTGGLLWDISNFGVNGSISIAVPEPSRALLLTLGLAVALLSRHKRKMAID